MLINAGRLSFFISFGFAVFFALAANTSEGRSFLIMMVCTLFHESVHIILLFMCGCKSAKLSFKIGGIAMEAQGFSLLSYKDTVLCTVAAPVMNIIAGGVFYLFYIKTRDSLLLEWTAVNLLLGTGNMLPFSFLDGGRALNAFLCRHLSYRKASEISDIFSVVTLILLGVIFFVLLIKGSTFMLVLFFFFYCLTGFISDKTKC